VTGQQSQPHRAAQPQRVGKPPVLQQPFGAPEPDRKPGKGDDDAGEETRPRHHKAAALQRQRCQQRREALQPRRARPGGHGQAGQRYVQGHRPSQRDLGRQEQGQAVEGVKDAALIVGRQRGAATGQWIPQRQVAGAPHRSGEPLPGDKLEQRRAPEEDLAGKEGAPEQQQRQQDQRAIADDLIPGQALQRKASQSANHGTTRKIT